jgi:dihydrofolate reductase
MRTLRIFANISLDGVIQAPGGRNEDGDYEHGGWSMRYFEPSVGEALIAAQGPRFDLLLGRRTYDIFARYWPDAGRSTLADRLNAATKYVATHRPDTLPWGPATSLGLDVVADVRRIKSQDGPGLIVWGSTTLTPALLSHGLVDEVVLMVYPVVLGKGKRLFAEVARPWDFALVSTTAASQAVTFNTYRPIGPPRN